MELVFIPVPAIGHIVSHVEFAKRLIDQDHRFSVTVLIVDPLVSPNVQSYVGSLAAAASHDDSQRLRFITFPHQLEPDHHPILNISKSRPQQYFFDFLECHKLSIKEFIIDHVLSNHSIISSAAAGFVVDLFTTPMIDVANELGFPSYLFFIFSAASLGFTSYVTTRHDQVDGKAFQASDDHRVLVNITGYENPVPFKLIPSVYSDEKGGGYICFMNFMRRFKETKAIIVNSFQELESHAVKSLKSKHDNIPPFYLVGPVLDLQGHSSSLCDEVQSDGIIKWLDEQPPSTVIFLCFGSLFDMDGLQVVEIAKGLEKSGHRFLWSLRVQSTSPKNLMEILPKGFLQRTEGRGLVCGWAPQVKVLHHKSVGGFVSHCGWNSVLESIWYGVPVLTWPMHSEQQLNAFQMVKDLGLAVEMRLDYKQGESDVVMGDEICKAVKCLMDDDIGGEVRKRVKKMSQMSREAVSKNSTNGTSFTSYGRIIELFMMGNDNSKS